MRESEVSAQRGLRYLLIESLRYLLMREPEVSAHDGEGTEEQCSQTESFSAVM